MAVRATKPLLIRWKRDEPGPRRPATAVSYQRLLVPLGTGREADEAMAVACRLASDRHAAVTALCVIEVPAELPLAAHMLEEEAEAHRRASHARTIGELYGVTVNARILRARSAGEAIVDEARTEGSEIIVIGTPRKRGSVRHVPVFGKTVDVVLKHAPCRVVVAALPRGA